MNYRLTVLTIAGCEIIWNTDNDEVGPSASQALEDFLNDDGPETVRINGGGRFITIVLSEVAALVWGAFEEETEEEIW